MKLLSATNITKSINNSSSNFTLMDKNRDQNRHKILGRPVKSEIRQNIAEILYFLGEGYAYDIYKIYTAVFPRVTMRSIYYHLRKGSNLGIFEIKAIRKEEGEYSWGSHAEKIYYKLGNMANPVGNLLVKEFLDRKLYKRENQ